MAVKKIWIATGGTGGHVFPALAVAGELARRGMRITISTDGRTRGMILRDRPRGARIAHVWASGVGAKSKLKQVCALGKIALSAFALALRFMIFRPDRVVAFGGYASVPAVIAARVWRIPTFLHEQNASIGRANKFALRWVGVLMTSFDRVEGIKETGDRRQETGDRRQETGFRMVYTGLPVRSEFKPTAYKSDHNLLVTGGSLGAQILDDVVPQSVLGLPTAVRKKIFVTHQTRPQNVARLQQFYAENKIRANVLSFINDMASTLSSASLVIGRSGASTVVELETVGRPAILVPLNINPDQAANAASFAQTGGGMAVDQAKFTPKWLTAALAELFENPARLTRMAARALVPNNAVGMICDEVLK